MISCALGVGGSCWGSDVRRTYYSSGEIPGDGAKMGLGAYVEKKPPAACALTGVAGSANGDPLAD